MRRQLRVRILLGSVLGAALISAPLPVAEASVPDLAPSPSRVVIRDPVRDILNGNNSQVSDKRKPTINFTRLAVTYGTWALRIRGSFINLMPMRTAETPGVPKYDMDYFVGTPAHPFDGEAGIRVRGPDEVTIGVETPDGFCPRARARWAYRRDFVNVRVPWRCLAFEFPRPPRGVVVSGHSDFVNKAPSYFDFVPSTSGHTPPVFRPTA